LETSSALKKNYLFSPFNYLWHMPPKARENIIKKIREALTTPVPMPFAESGDSGDVFHKPSQDLDITFAEAFTKLQGQFSFCFTPAEMVHQMTLLAEAKKWDRWYCNQQALKQIFGKHKWPFEWHNQLENCHASITTCEALVARTGTMILSSTASGGRTPSVYAPAHICVAYTSQLVYDIRDGLELLQRKYNGQLPSLVSFASGPSRTADIEKTLVTGVHGPKEVYCFLIEG
jgi:L-lactate dehydrogenase complex protein LldG